MPTTAHDCESRSLNIETATSYQYCGRTSSPKKTADSNEEELVLASQQNTVNVKHANEAFDRFCRMVENDVDSRKNRVSLIIKN